MNKIIIMSIAFVVLSLSAKAQTKDSLYVVTYTTGSSWDLSKPPGEQLYIKEHSARLGQLRKDGVIKFGARYGEKGMIVISASTFASAKEIIFADQAIVNKLFAADVQKFNIFL